MKKQRTQIKIDELINPRNENINTKNKFLLFCAGVHRQNNQFVWYEEKPQAKQFVWCDESALKFHNYNSENCNRVFEKMLGPSHRNGNNG